MVALSLLQALPFIAGASASALFSTYSFDPLQHLSGIAPFFEPEDPAASPDAPPGCTPKRAAYIVRHAAIYANDFDFEEYIEPFLKKLNNHTNIDWNKVPYLNFLADWRPPISDEEVSLLTRMGRLEATQLGVDLNFRYPNLTIPKRIWSSSSKRTKKSARSLANGLEEDDHDIDLVSVLESNATGANSLTPWEACPAYSGSAGAEQANQFKKVFTKPIMARFNALAPGFNFTVDDVYGMQQLCGYETVIRGSSPFCNMELFSADDWLGWEYCEDIRYHYSVGYGFPAAGYVGMPWVNATGKLLLKDGDKDKDDEDLYVSFTHREMAPFVTVAMGLFNNTEFGGGGNNINDTLPLDRINYRRQWRTSHILPFLTNIAIERFECEKSPGFEDGDYYRVLVNSAPQPLPDCVDGPGTSCSRKSFEKYLNHRSEMFSGFSKECGVTNKNSTDVLTIYEQSSAKNKTRT